MRSASLSILLNSSTTCSILPESSVNLPNAVPSPVFASRARRASPILLTAISKSFCASPALIVPSVNPTTSLSYKEIFLANF